MKFTPVRLAQSLLALLPVVDGQLIFAWDTGNVYVDTAYGRFQQGISMLSDSSEIPLAPADKLYFNKDTKQLLYNGLNVFAGGMQKVAVESDAVALIGKWYLCFNDAVITLPAVHNENDTVKVSTVLDVDNVTVKPAAGDTVQSDSGFLLNINNSSVELTWLNGRWVASLVVIPRLKAPFAIVDSLPLFGDLRVYYCKRDNKTYYWDGAWRSIDSYQADIHQYTTKLGRCIDIGMMLGTSHILLAWKDPQDVLLDTAILALWKQTKLLKKKGGYPISISDSQASVVEVTSRLLNNRDSRFNNPIQLTWSDSTYYKLFSLTMLGAWNNLLTNCYPVLLSISWGMVQNIVRQGNGAEKFPVGTVFLVPHIDYASLGHGLRFRVVGYDLMPARLQALIHTMCLDMVGVLFTDLYDAKLLAYALTQDMTAQSGKTYYIYLNSDYTALVLGTDYAIGDTVPAGTWYLKNIAGRGGAGSNNAAECNMIQWANSTGAANQWFTPQTIWDTCSTTLAAKNGFMYNIDPAFLAVVQLAQLITSLSNTEGGAGLVHYAKFWPLSRTQIYGNYNGSVLLNLRLTYYKDGGSCIKYDINTNSTATNWLTRSPYISGSDGVYNITTTGTSAHYNSTTPVGYSLACIIA